MNILFNDPSKYFVKNKKYLSNILAKVIDSKSYILSDAVRNFENKIINKKWYVVWEESFTSFFRLFEFFFNRL